MVCLNITDVTPDELISIANGAPDGSVVSNKSCQMTVIAPMPFVIISQSGAIDVTMLLPATLITVDVDIGKKVFTNWGFSIRLSDDTKFNIGTKPKQFKTSFYNREK